MDEREIIKLLEFGIWAPSADNLQPWKFKIKNGQIELWIDPLRAQNFCDEGLFAPYLSAGAVIENIRVAAAEHDEELSVSYFPDPRNLEWVAQLRFSKQNSPNRSPHFSVLKKRLTNRKFYSAQNIDSHIYSKLEHQVETYENFKLLWIKKSDSNYAQLMQILGKADQLRFEHERLHREFMQTMRWSQEHQDTTKDGLNFRTLEAGPGSIYLFKLISSWKRMNLLNRFGMSRMFNWYAQLQLKSSQACGLIVSKNHTPLDFVLGGEVMEKLWHEATLQGLSLQPMEGLPIFLIRLLESDCKEFNSEQRAVLEELKATFKSLFSIHDTNGLILLFRLGYANQPQVRSARRDIESFLVK